MFGAPGGKCPLAQPLAQVKRELKAAGCPGPTPAACAVVEIEAEHAMRSSFWKDLLLEDLALAKSSEEAHAEQRSYGDLPLIVLTAGRTEDIPIPQSQVHALWLATKEAHDRVAALSSRGVNFVVAGSGHFVQVDQPTAVISAVDEIVDQARYGAQP